MNSHTMPKSKVAISIDRELLRGVDRLVRAGTFPSRSQAIEAAVQEKLARLDRVRLVRETARLDPAFERALAEEGVAGALGEWPEY